MPARSIRPAKRSPLVAPPLVLTNEAGVRQQTRRVVVLLAPAGALMPRLAVVLELSPAGPETRTANNKSLHHHIYLFFFTARPHVIIVQDAYAPHPHPHPPHSSTWHLKAHPFPVKSHAGKIRTDRWQVKFFVKHPKMLASKLGLAGNLRLFGRDFFGWLES